MFAFCFVGIASVYTYEREFNRDKKRRVRVRCQWLAIAILSQSCCVYTILREGLGNQGSGSEDQTLPYLRTFVASSLDQFIEM